MFNLLDLGEENCNKKKKYQLSMFEQESCMPRRRRRRCWAEYN